MPPHNRPYSPEPHPGIPDEIASSFSCPKPLRGPPVRGGSLRYYYRDYPGLPGRGMKPTISISGQCGLARAVLPLDAPRGFLRLEATITP